AAGMGDVAVSWSVPADGGSPLTSFKLYRGTSSGGEGATPIATLSSATTSYTDSAVSNGTRYWYTVGANNANGETRSTEANATPSARKTVAEVTGAAGTGQGGM